MSMMTPFPRVPINSKPSNKPTALQTNSTRHKHVQKRHAVWLRNAEPTINMSPCIRTHSQVTMAAAQLVPPALSTHLHTGQSNLPPPSSIPGFAATVMQQQQHQYDIVWLSRCITQLENEVHQALSVMDADTGKLLNYRQLMQTKRHGASHQPTNLDD